MKVYIVQETESVDYHGSYTEIVAVFGTEKQAIDKVYELEVINNKYSMSYDYDVYNVE